MMRDVVVEFEGRYVIPPPCPDHCCDRPYVDLKCECGHEERSYAGADAIWKHILERHR